jgi:WXXGXW repeat (2 copies)
MRKTLVICCVLFAALILAMPTTTSAQIAVGISVHIGPPALPVYVQPVCPAPGYMWTPGYWAYGDAGYYWVPGTWVVAPVGMLWTPGYWGWAGGLYVWHGGYWGPHVGFYGGINYGFGYGGVGFVGGEWRGGVFAYNTAVTHVDTTVIHTTYVNRTVVNTTVVNRVSYNGGTGGTIARPTAAEMAAEHEHHIEPTAEQTQHEHAAASNPSFRYSANHGNPAVAATSKPGEFSGHGVVAARNAQFHPPAHNAANTQANAHASNTFHPPSNANNSSSHNSSNGSNKTYNANESHSSKTPPSHPQNKPAEHEKDKGKPQK